MMKSTSHIPGAEEGHYSTSNLHVFQSPSPLTLANGAPLWEDQDLCVTQEYVEDPDNKWTP